MPRKERDEKRRDNKGRLLKSGESQRSDGRYAYKYINTFGEPQFVYSWKLVPTDKVPAGKRPCLSLREKIKQIQKDLDDGIDTIGKKMTVLARIRALLDEVLGHSDYSDVQRMTSCKPDVQ